MVIDRCEISDLPREQCAHCGASPGDRIAVGPQNAPSSASISVFDQAALPSSWATRTDPPNLRLRDREQGCACGRPTRDDAYACDDCAGELTRFLADAPWIAEQLDVTITGQRGKRPTSGSSRGDDALPWNDKAAAVQHALKAHLIATVRTCIRTHVRHQSPHAGPPANSVASVSKWLLWRVDGLMFSTAFPNILRESLAIERRATSVIDRAPDRQFLGMCELARLKLCDGAVYVKAGELVGKCRECGMRYDAEDRRKSLEKALDDQLVTAADIARLATYLGVPASREAVRKTVNRWHSRKVLVAKKLDPDGTPRFRYGDVAPLLSIAYDKKEIR